jgi:hypothetical protein
MTLGALMRGLTYKSPSNPSIPPKGGPYIVPVHPLTEEIPVVCIHG